MSMNKTTKKEGTMRQNILITGASSGLAMAWPSNMQRWAETWLYALVE